MLQLPADYYTSIPRQQNKNVGTPQKRTSGGSRGGDDVGVVGVEGRGDNIFVEDEDESQGVRWGSDEEYAGEEEAEQGSA